MAVAASMMAALVHGCASNVDLASISAMPESAPTDRMRVELQDAPGRALALAGTATSPTASAPPAGETKDFDVVTVMWGTNRESVANASGVTASAATSAPKFTAKRGSWLTTGYAKVTIPKVDRAFGAIPLASGEYTLLNVRLYGKNEDPNKHFTIGESRAVSERDFLARGNAIGARSKAYPGHAFVYVHGFWNSFEDSLYRTAQLTHDMGFDGIPYSFAWPSKGTVGGYLYDRDSVDASQQQFLEFLELVSKTTKAQKIHIIAHSMGARLVVDALFPAVGKNRLAELPKIDQIVLAAADVDQSVMKARAAAISGGVKAMTLYASDRDEALVASERLAGSAPRAGEVRSGRPFIMSGVETIDISSAGTVVFLGNNHNKYATSQHILRDIAVLMKNGVHPPDVRFPIFATAAADDGKYWRYVKD